ncbi:uncharacterized protein LOC123537862 isoform X2 [Mercenaria mercenaria]|uniref:uncharacterized protein LOC123537862 isoform X2 n=1 Tax=Mercenaria mercenaria TaxID=6596 RepID=UPI00234E87BD|nr:uncharacterized protein LOC123537862 isoform X2 [Mercenaria mercenaria]
MAYNLLLGILTVLCFTAVNGIRCSYYDYKYGWTYSKVTKYKYCASSCCGDMDNRYCCKISEISEINSNVGLIVGISIGSILLVVTVVTVFVVICCCCNKSRGQTGQVVQPASVTTTTVHGMQSVPSTSYGQTGYINGAYPLQIQTANMVPGTAQKWQEPPPEYTTNNI